MSSAQDRFSFAKKVITARKKGGAGAGPGMEESVVLAFRDGTTAVCVTRKTKRKGALWKVEA